MVDTPKWIRCPATIRCIGAHTEYVKRESTVIAWVNKKNSLLLMNFHVLYVLEDKINKKVVRPSVCLPACLSGCTHLDFCCRHNNFRKSKRIRKKFGGCLLCMKRSSSIKIQSKIMILILILIMNRILILTKTLRNDTKFIGYL